jgi:hypothetical protein
MERAAASALWNDSTLRDILLDARNLSGEIFPLRSTGHPLRLDFGFRSRLREGDTID